MLPEHAGPELWYQPDRTNLTRFTYAARIIKCLTGAMSCRHQQLASWHSANVALAEREAVWS